MTGIKSGIYVQLAEVPGVARKIKKNGKKNIKIQSRGT